MISNVDGIDKAPMPQLYNNSKLPYKHKIVWYALLHFEVWPIMTKDIHSFLGEFDVGISPNSIGHIMRHYCSRNYFKRRKNPKIYEYMPLDKFLVLQKQYMEDLD